MDLTVALRMTSECPSTRGSTRRVQCSVPETHVGRPKTLKQRGLSFFPAAPLPGASYSELLFSFDNMFFLFLHIIEYFTVFHDFIKGISDKREHMHLLDFSVHTSMLLEHIFC